MSTYESTAPTDRAIGALSPYREHLEDGEALSALLADLRHWAALHGIDYATCDTDAQGFFDQEQGQARLAVAQSIVRGVLDATS